MGDAFTHNVDHCEALSISEYNVIQKYISNNRDKRVEGKGIKTIFSSYSPKSSKIFHIEFLLEDYNLNETRKTFNFRFYESGRLFYHILYWLGLSYREINQMDIALKEEEEELKSLINYGNLDK